VPIGNGQLLVAKITARRGASVGELTLLEAGELLKIVESYARALQASEFEERLEMLENKHRDS
jgi:hypothetical protein